MSTLKTAALLEMKTIRVRISRSSERLKTWKHVEHVDLPVLQFEYDDLKKCFSAKEDEMRKFSNSYWERLNKNGVMYKAEYERNLREAVTNAVYAVEEKWQNRFEKDANATFKS